jgi:hypothetical protein
MEKEVFLMDLKPHLWLLLHTILIKNVSIQVQLKDMYINGKEIHVQKLLNYMKAQLWVLILLQENYYHQAPKII